MAKDSKLTCRMITPTFRLSHPHLFKPQAPKPSDKQKFSITMLFPKGTDLMGATLKTDNEESRAITINEVIKNARVTGWGADKEKWPKKRTSPIRDGDDDEFSNKEGYKDHWVIKATSSEDQRPGIVDAAGVPITEASVIYPGCYCRAYVYARTWEYMGKHGVQFILDHIQKLKDGKSFGGKKPVEQVFGPVGDGSDGGDFDGDEDEVDFM